MRNRGAGLSEVIGVLVGVGLVHYREQDQLMEGGMECMHCVRLYSEHCSSTLCSAFSPDTCCREKDKVTTRTLKARMD